MTTESLFWGPRRNGWTQIIGIPMNNRLRSTSEEETTHENNDDDTTSVCVRAAMQTGSDFLQIFDLFRAYDDSAAEFNAINGDVIANNSRE